MCLSFFTFFSPVFSLYLWPICLRLFLWSALTARSKITHDWQPAAWSENSHLSHSAASCQVRYAKPCFRKFPYCQILLAANVFHFIILEGKKTLGKTFKLLWFSFGRKKNKNRERKYLLLKMKLHLLFLTVFLVSSNRSSICI